MPVEQGETASWALKSFKQGTGMSAAATCMAHRSRRTGHGHRSMGMGFALPYLIKKAKESNDPDLFWEAHLVG